MGHCKKADQQQRNRYDQACATRVRNRRNHGGHPRCWITGVTKPIVVPVELILVVGSRAVVAGIANPIPVGVRLVKVEYGGAVVLDV